MTTGNHLYDFLVYSYICLLFCLAVLLFFRYKLIDKASRFLCLLMWLVCLTETVAQYAAIKYHSNIPVYTIYGFAEFILISLYFNYSIDTFQKRDIGYYIAAIGVSIGIANTIWYQPLHTLNTNYIFLECISIVCMSLYSFYRFLLTSTTMRLYERVHFWFPCIFLFNWCATLSSYGLYDHFLNVVRDKVSILNISLTSVSILTYLAFGIVFFFYPKMKSIHE